ncbi:ribokinase [Fusobacterium naviforme]|nr:ribokinase [Fusobacterium naviforme]STO26538.1 Ribokinase [Fusobacterium naviforme]
MRKKVTVFGSFVVDLMGRTPHLPVPGETVKGSMFRMGPGGKGFNQGVAAHKAGAEVAMVTKLGEDSFAEVALAAMRELKMDTRYIFRTGESETGAALIMVDEATSQNEIVVVLGACNSITDSEVESLGVLLSESEYLLTQLETNVSAVERVVKMAGERGAKVILNTAPVQAISDELLSRVDLITPNEVEAEILTGIPVTSEENAARAADWFFAKGVKEVIITLGDRGVYVATKQRRGRIPAFQVKAVDTTGAGDAFNGGLVTALTEGQTLWEAAVFASALAALSVQKLGTTPAMPVRAEIDAFLREHKEEWSC